jgi:hypothetical protein
VSATMTGAHASSFNSILSLVPEFANSVLNRSLNDCAELKIPRKGKLSDVYQESCSVREFWLG